MAGDEWEYQVRHRAYELWNAAGRPDGKHQQFWEAAERELKRAEVSGAAKGRGEGMTEPAGEQAGAGTGLRRDPT